LVLQGETSGTLRPERDLADAGVTDDLF
jgi:hypothetical protein